MIGGVYTVSGVSSRMARHMGKVIYGSHKHTWSRCIISSPRDPDLDLSISQDRWCVDECSVPPARRNYEARPCVWILMTRDPSNCRRQSLPPDMLPGRQ